MGQWRQLRLSRISPPISQSQFCLRESSTLETYGLRWRIEVIFKAWKSQMDFHVIHRGG
jgi:hypothetical protein